MPFFATRAAGIGLGMALTETLIQRLNGSIDVCNIAGQGNTSREYASSTQTNLTYAIGGGVSYAPVERVNFDLGYRYVDMGKIESGYNDFANARGLKDEQMKARLVSNEFTLGVRYLF